MPKPEPQKTPVDATYISERRKSRLEANANTKDRSSPLLSFSALHCPGHRLSVAEVVDVVEQLCLGKEHSVASGASGLRRRSV